MKTKVSYQLVKHDENFNNFLKPYYYFTVRQDFHEKHDADIPYVDIEFMVSPAGLLFHVIDEKNSNIIGLRDYMNFPQDLQDILLSEYKRFVGLVEAIHKVDE